MKTKNLIAQKILTWYDENARQLPWRIEPSASTKGILPNPYSVWLSEIMLQQTTTKAVAPYYSKFLKKWPNVDALACESEETIMAAWAGLGYYSRARNLIKCAKEIVENHNSMFPEDERSLLMLPGVGPYTAAAIRSIAFNKKAVVIDGNVDRVIVRLYGIRTPIANSKAKIRSLATKLIPNSRFGDYAQAVMDLGSTLCTPKLPSCKRCPISIECKAKKDKLTNIIPLRKTKVSRPTRYGYAFIIFSRKGYVLMLRRPKDGLLGGMIGYPTSNWTIANFPSFIPPFKLDWTFIDTTIRHSFSHFDLELKLVSSFINFVPDGYLEKNINNNTRMSLPTLMRKVYDVMDKVRQTH